jgi:DNA polymerase-3 subunit gamma/tau
VLATDTRPRKFSDVVGHEKNMKSFTKKASTLEFDFPDVMFLTGNTGSGKTTSAFIIASTINCKDPVMNEQGYYDPCGTCPSCQSVIKETFNKDIHFFRSSEMDKDAMVELDELAASTPMWGGRKQVIIIDEAQNLTKGSKGVALNLLEHKRKNCIFILCTMDASAFDKATISRGQVYDFKPLSTNEIIEAIAKQLDIIDPDEKLPFEPDALALLAQNSYGSARQALAYLERCIDSELYTVADVEKELSFISDAKAYKMVDKLLSKSADFFTDLATVKNVAFYNYAWAVLSNIKKELIVGELDQDNWKYKSSKKMINNPNFEALCKTFIDINRDCEYYFKDYIFDYHIGNFMYNKAPIVEVRKPATRMPRSN